MASETYDGERGRSQKTLLQWLISIIATITAIGSITSLGSNLFSGLEFINWIIDTWHSIFSPAVVWLNEYVFVLIDIEISQMEVDLIVVLGLVVRILNRIAISFAGGSHPHRPGQLISWFVVTASWLGMSAWLVYSDLNLVNALATIKSGNYTHLWLLGTLFVGHLLFRRSGQMLLRLVSAYSCISVSMFILFLLIEFNSQADENLPYVERWLTAWDDIFVEE